MPIGQPVVLRSRELQDDELRNMLLSVIASGDTGDFFGKFEYFFPNDPNLTLQRGETLLAQCLRLAPDVYAKLHKGTPFYWLAWATFLSHDYETAAFYIDAAVSEDIKNNAAAVSTPALLFFLIDESSAQQAMLPFVKALREQIDVARNKYNSRPGAATPPLLFSHLQDALLKPAISKGQENLRTLVTTFISYSLEWKHRSDLIKLRIEQGTAEPFFIHLFKGCVLFESLLKANPKRKPQEKMLGKILGELQSELGFGSKPQMTIGNFDFQKIVADLASDDSSVYTAVERTGRIRNTTGHNLGWAVSITPSAYDALAAYVASSCLHAIASLYR